ncbi:MAG TPA: methionine--tRNA ligase [Acholeplasma sp.]|jgi:methionyl-tRNA synthetase|nr:methionine--tRNA ligase [Acholeplasmatales bacterium]HHV33713.1 methionine--tRNA ligase [Acholeplasma sp.]
MSKKFYITTAIPYVSGVPHVGNVYEMILADSIARYKRLEGYDVLFQTGTDEHGLKIETAAKDKGVPTKEYVDEITAKIIKMYEELDIVYDKFVRTTDEMHMKTVQRIFARLYEQGDIFLGKYAGWYSVSEEAYIFDKDAIEQGVGPAGDKLIWMEEETYFLDLKKYQKRLVNHIEKNPDFILPISRKNEMINNFLKEPLPDLSVTRTTLEWGIPVLDGKHKVYVWIDALSNYITGFDLDENFTSREMERYWPADVHVIGKDILRFHTIYWPTILMCLGIELPKTIFGHPWILVNKDKMSKSTGNVLYTTDILKYFKKDTLRYYVLHEIPYQADGNLTYELLIEKHNSDLANTLGNLVNRTLGMIKKYQGGVVKKEFTKGEYGLSLKEDAAGLLKRVTLKMNEYRVGDALDEVMKTLRNANKFIDLTEPWNLNKKEETKTELAGVLYEIIETIRICAVILQAFIPESAREILKQINTDLDTFVSIEEFGGYPNNNNIGEAKVLFERYNVDEKMEEILREQK